MRIAVVQLYMPQTKEVVLRKYLSAKEFDEFKRQFDEGRWMGLRWKIQRWIRR